jgi:cation:H+ antiporter
MVYAAVAMARQFGVSELVIGLTIVAVGTSLPELATSVLGTIRGESDIVVGNVIGSNIFNIMFVLPMVALVHPMQAKTEKWEVDVAVMIGFSIALVPIMVRKLKISRIEGVALVLAYAAFLIFQATR